MAKLAATLTDVLLRRIRDPSGIGTSRVFARARLSDAQRIVNLALGLVLNSTTLTTTPRRLLYTLTGDLATTGRVVAVREGGRDLARLTSLTQLGHISRQWFRETGTRFEAWVPIGRDLLVVYPAKIVSSSVEVVSTKLTTALTGEADATDLADEYLDVVVELATAILLLRQRDLASAKDAIERLALRLGPDVIPERLHAMAPQAIAANAGEAR